jgi:predicted ATPase
MMVPIIEAFRVAYFKSFGTAAALPLSPLTLLVGANASGKSNLLEAIQILSWLANGHKLDGILQAVQEEDLALRGGIVDLRHGEHPSFKLWCAVSGETRSEVLKIRIAFREDGLHIDDEVLWQGGEKLYWVQYPAPPGGAEMWVSYNNFARGGSKPQIRCVDQKAVFTQLDSPARFAKKHQRAQEIIPEAAARVRAALERIFFLNPTPSRMRGYSFIVDRKLHSHGANVSSVLYHLCEEPAQKERVLGFIRELPEQDIRDVRFLKTERAEVMVRLTECFGAREETRDAPLLSDGTLRVLAIAAALLSAPAGSVVVIEEIDNGIHPSRAGMLLRNMQQAALDRGLRVLITSHNPALADALPLEAVPNVVYCYRDPQDGDSRLVRLDDLPNYPQLVAQGPLGRLMTQGILERLAKNPTRPEDAPPLPPLDVPEGTP